MSACSLKFNLLTAYLSQRLEPCHRKIAGLERRVSMRCSNAPMDGECCFSKSKMHHLAPLVEALLDQFIDLECGRQTQFARERRQHRLIVWQIHRKGRPAADIEHNVP